MATVVGYTVLFAALIGALTALKIPFKHHNYDALTSVLVNMTSSRPDLATLYSVGKSIHGRELWVVMLTSSATGGKLLKPSVKYVANMHGNEVVGKELMIHLIAHLLNGYDSDPRIRWLLDNTNVHIMPSMNPDGMSISTEGQCFGVRGRYNSAGVDLNRNFPEYGQSKSRREQPETTAIKNWINTIQFVLSGNLHGGAMLVRYPFDSALTPGQVGSKTPDDDVFQYLGRTYSFNHPTMRRFSCEDQPYKDGIINGAKWYPFKGSMPDYTYLQAGSMELTLELSCCKHPPSYQLQGYWLDNVKSLMRFMEEAHRGVRGIVSDDIGAPIPKATLMIKGRYMPFRTTENGEYWRILLPGSYVLMVSAPEHVDAEVPFDVIDGRTTVVNVTLVPKNRDYQDIYDARFQKPDLGNNAELSSLTADDGDTVNALPSVTEQRPPIRTAPSRTAPLAPLVTKEPPPMTLADYYYALYKAVQQLTSGNADYRDPSLSSEQMTQAERVATVFRDSMTSHHQSPFLQPESDPDFQRRSLEDDVPKLQSHATEVSGDTISKANPNPDVDQGEVGVGAEPTALPLAVPPGSVTSYQNSIPPSTSLTQALLSTTSGAFREDKSDLPSTLPFPTQSSLTATPDSPSSHPKIYIPSSISLPPFTLQQTTSNVASGQEGTGSSPTLPLPTQPSSAPASSQETSARAFPSQSLPQTTASVVYSGFPQHSNIPSIPVTPPSTFAHHTETIPQDIESRQSLSAPGSTPTTLQDPAVGSAEDSSRDQTHRPSEGEIHKEETPPTTQDPHGQKAELHRALPRAPESPDIQKQQEEVNTNTSVPSVQQQTTRAATFPPIPLQPATYSPPPPPSTVIQTTRSFPATTGGALTSGYRAPPSAARVTQGLSSIVPGPPGQPFTGTTLLQRLPQTTVTALNRPAIGGLVHTSVTPTPQLLHRSPLISSTPGSFAATTTLKHPLLIPETVIGRHTAGINSTASRDQIARVFHQGYGRQVIPPRLPGIHGTGIRRTPQVHAVVQGPYSVPPIQYQRTNVPSFTTVSPPTTKSGIGDEPCCFDGPNAKFVFRIGK